MSHYRRARSPGATYFFTVVTEGRAAFLCDPLARALLRQSIAHCRVAHPFDLLAIVLLPDHLHTLWKLPPDDHDFSKRWALIKSSFTRAYLNSAGLEAHRSPSRLRHRRRGIWQRHFWEHRVRDENELQQYLDYIHYNPVKHNHAKCPHAWPYSSFHKWVRNNTYSFEWLCTCDGRAMPTIGFGHLSLDGLD